MKKKKRKCHVVFVSRFSPAIMEPDVNLMIPNPLHKQALLMTEAHANVVLFLVNIWISSTLSFLFNNPLMSGICKPNKQTHCLSSRPVWGFSGPFSGNFRDSFREVSGQFSRRLSGAPNTTNKGFLRFIAVFRKIFRSILRSTSGRISRHLPGNFRKVFRILEQI